MDYTQIQHTRQNSIPTGVWYLIPPFILATVIKSFWFEGKAVQAVVNLFAKLFFNKIRYHLIRADTLPTEDGTTQVRHIIVSRYGVFELAGAQLTLDGGAGRNTSEAFPEIPEPAAKPSGSWRR
ncbi:hypothetical protein [Marinobacter sp.]|uniref:hypothetical protein n=1 Tax=Marinobacter sp. TaxID=50741 RepID=UPI003B51B222